MATHVLSSIYRINDNDLYSGYTTDSGNRIIKNPATRGVPNSFPSNLVRFYPIADGPVVANGVTMNSIIALLPTGLNQPEKRFYTADTVAALNTLANTADS